MLIMIARPLTSRLVSVLQAPHPPVLSVQLDLTPTLQVGTCATSAQAVDLVFDMSHSNYAMKQPIPQRSEVLREGAMESERTVGRSCKLRCADGPGEWSMCSHIPDAGCLVLLIGQ